MPSRREAFQSGNQHTGRRGDGRDTGADSEAVDQHGAGNAGTDAASEFGAFQVKVITQSPKERGVGRDVDVHGLVVYGQFQGHGPSCGRRVGRSEDAAIEEVSTSR